MIRSVEIRIEGGYSLFVPADGLDLTLVRDDFNLLTNTPTSRRPLHTTETFELPLEPNRQVLEAIRGTSPRCELIYNDIVVMVGILTEFSADEQNKIVLVTVVSLFKEVVDYMGDNVLYLDKIDLSRYDYTVPDAFDSTHDNDLLKFGYYNPMDATTGKIEFNQSNINDYCKPSLNWLGYFRELFRLTGWTADLGNWPATLQGECLMPTTAYKCSSFGFSLKGAVTVPAASSMLMPLTTDSQLYNISKEVQGVPTPGAEILPDNRVQARQPNRVMSFKIKSLHTCPDPFSIILHEGENELVDIQSVGENAISYVTDELNLSEGLDPLQVEIVNPNPYPITIDFSELRFYNLFSIYETDADEFVSPVGYYFPVADNFPQITPLDAYLDILTRYQLAQENDDQIRQASYYAINDIPAKDFQKIDVEPYLLWDGYEILGDKIDGLAKINAIRYKDDTKRQRFFRIDLPSLDASGVYFESIFAHGQTDNGWKAVQVPALKYKVKTVEVSTGDDTTANISVEYLEYSDIAPMVGYYEKLGTNTGRMIFAPLQMATLVQKHWNRFLQLLSSHNGYNPAVYNLHLRLTYYQYLDMFKQSNLFYNRSDCMLMEGNYNIMTEEFTGTFVRLE